MRLLWVVPRFGSATVGGAERLVRGLATHALPDGWSSEIATTCAVDHETWENVLEPGESVEDGLVVRRFRVGSRDDAPLLAATPSILSGRGGLCGRARVAREQRLGARPASASSKTKADAYDLVLFSPYLFGRRSGERRSDRSAAL